jgi:hypothetical protein
VNRPAATDFAYDAKAAADAGPRFWIRADGQLAWGPGDGVADVSLYRSAADTLKTDDVLAIERPSSGSTALAARLPADAVSRFQLLVSGALEWGDGTAARDTNLYRPGGQNDTLRTDDAFQVGVDNGYKNALSLTGTTLNTGITIGGDVNLYRQGADVLATDDRFAVRRSGAATDPALTTSYTGGVDSTPRFQVDASGAHAWGTGSAAVDTTLYRGAPDNLKTDDAFTIERIAGTNDALMVQLVGDAQSRFKVAASGGLAWGDGTAARDTNLYRSAADILATDDRLNIVRQGTTHISLSTRSTEAQSRFQVLADGSLLWGDGVSATLDTNLYRSAQDTLKTDDALVAASLEAPALKVTGGSPGVGKVLTSDAAGSAAWATPVTPVTPNTQIFTANGTWTKPAGATLVKVAMLGAGGGGGSGRVGAAASLRTAGAGGGGGSYSERLFRAADLAATEAVVVGGPSAGGAAVAAASTNGNAGTTAGATTFGNTSGGTLPTKVRAGGGGGGGAGNATAAATAGASGSGAFGGGLGGTSSATGGGGTAAGNSTAGAGAGGGGGGITTADANSAGASGSTSASVSSVLIGTGGATVGAAGVAGPDYATQFIAGFPSPSQGGGGGAGGAATANGGAGGAGGTYGGGGGGGGAATNGFSSGAGGAGAGGLCVVTSW